ncbi:two-component sensor histidine kinase [Marinitenerispora sediminis]|nr:two-component sensor histidine kinase [Marinitenerispora sediminis]
MRVLSLLPDQDRSNLKLVPAVLGLVLVTSVFAAQESRPLLPWGLALILLSCASLLWRNRYPGAVGVVASVTAMGYYVAGFPDGLIVLTSMVALFTAVARGRRWQGWGFGLGFYTAFFLWEVTVLGFSPFWRPLANLEWVLLTLISGEVARKHGQFEQARREREAAAKQSREEELLRRAADERLRLAREVHDVVAHNISLINVQAGTALYLIDSEPQRAAEALATIKETSRETLRELRATLGVLRAVDEPAPRAPAPGLAGVPELVERARAAGVAVTDRWSGVPRALSAGADSAAYRIVQEALTNAVRHAAATAVVVEVAVKPDGVRLRVADDGRGAPADWAPGNGITGMRERASAVGGVLTAGNRADGGFEVAAWLPAPAAVAGGAA